jgi:hypothetical protein
MVLRQSQSPAKMALKGRKARNDVEQNKNSSQTGTIFFFSAFVISLSV